MGPPGPGMLKLVTEATAGGFAFQIGTKVASTWARDGVDANGDGTVDRWDPADAIFAAANYLKASGAPADTPGAVFAYNHSQAYVDEVLRWASTYAAEVGASAASAPTAAAATAVRFALAQIGTPYLWGGEGPGGASILRSIRSRLPTSPT